MNYKRKSKEKAIEKAKNLVEMYCNNCQSIHLVHLGNTLVEEPRCNNRLENGKICGHLLCKCTACQLTMKLIKKGVLKK